MPDNRAPSYLLFYTKICLCLIRLKSAVDVASFDSASTVIIKVITSKKHNSAVPIIDKILIYSSARIICSCGKLLAGTRLAAFLLFAIRLAAVHSFPDALNVGVPFTFGSKCHIIFLSHFIFHPRGDLFLYAEFQHMECKHHEAVELRVKCSEIIHVFNNYGAGSPGIILGVAEPIIFDLTLEQCNDIARTVIAVIFAELERLIATYQTFEVFGINLNLMRFHLFFLLVYVTFLPPLRGGT